MKKISKRKESGKIDTNFDLIMGGKKNKKLKKTKKNYKKGKTKAKQKQNKDKKSK